MDTRAVVSKETLERFWGKIWPEAFRDFSRSGVELKTSDGTGEIRKSPADRPVIMGLQHGVINLVLTNHIPMYWDNGRALAGVSALYGPHHLCMIALRYAHGHQIPFLSVNTCVHEMLHVLLQDIYANRPKWYQAGEHETRIDWYATRMWLFRDGSAIRKAARAYVERLRATS
jgi:hypothetical protein